MGGCTPTWRVANGIFGQTWRPPDAYLLLPTCLVNGAYRFSMPLGRLISPHGTEQQHATAASSARSAVLKKRTHGGASTEILVVYTSLWVLPVAGHSCLQPFFNASTQLLWKMGHLCRYEVQTTQYNYMGPSAGKTGGRFTMQHKLCPWQILFPFAFFFSVIFQTFSSSNEHLTEACLNIYGVVSSLEQCINPLCLYLSQGWVRYFKITLSGIEHLFWVLTQAMSNY